MNYCPICATHLVKRDIEEKIYNACPKCTFVHWNGPVHVVAVLIPRESGLVMVKRGVAPGLGKWCFPCGYIDSCESAYDAAIREPLEETGLLTRPNKLLDTFCPTPIKNQNINVYVSRIIGGEMRAGSDSTDVGIFSPDCRPEFAFTFHKALFNAWFAGAIKLDTEDSVPFKLS